jgi:hypothetical protein
MTTSQGFGLAPPDGLTIEECLPYPVFEPATES